LKKILSVVSIACLFFLLFSSSNKIQAVEKYLHGDPNYEWAWGHANMQFYVDKSSCFFEYNNKDEYKFAQYVIGNDIISGPGEPFVCYFKGKKDGTLPYYYDKERNMWRTIPMYDTPNSIAGEMWPLYKGLFLVGFHHLYGYNWYQRS
jgi:hypothetical protein